MPCLMDRTWLTWLSSECEYLQRGLDASGSNVMVIGCERSPQCFGAASRALLLTVEQIRRLTDNQWQQEPLLSLQAVACTNRKELDQHVCKRNLADADKTPTIKSLS